MTLSDHKMVPYANPNVSMGYEDRYNPSHTLAVVGYSIRLSGREQQGQFLLLLLFGQVILACL